MITVAIAEVFFFVEFNPLSEWTGGENGLPGVPTPSVQSRLHHAPFHHRLVALSVPRGLLLRRHRDRAAHCALAGRRDSARNPRQSAACGRCRPQHPRLQARGFRDRCSLCRLCRRVARRDAGLHAAGRLHVRDVRATGDADRNRWYRHAVRSAARRCGVACFCRTFCRRHSNSARPGNSCLASSSCCWCASCGTA